MTIALRRRACDDSSRSGIGSRNFLVRQAPGAEVPLAGGDPPKKATSMKQHNAKIQEVIFIASMVATWFFLPLLAYFTSKPRVWR